MKLAAYYATIAVVFGLLAIVVPAIGQSIVTAFVLGALLLPAVYAEVLRVRNHH